MNPAARFVAASLFTVIVAGSVPVVRAQQIEPRAYANAPLGVNFALAGYARVDGSVVVDPTLHLENANLEVNTTLVAYVRTFAMWGKPAKADVIVPYTWLAGTAELDGQPRSRDVDGFADAGARLSVILAGAPALQLKEFVAWRQSWLVGASVSVSAPTGQYDASKLINIGTNRWLLKPEVGVSWAVARWTLELATAVSFFGTNDDFFGGHAREQAPVYSVQGGFIYNFPRGVWAALNGTYFAGGRTTLDGVDGDDELGNTRAGLTVAFPLSRRSSIKLYGSSGVSTRTGGDYDLVSATWQYRWGGGL